MWQLLVGGVSEQRLGSVFAAGWVTVWVRGSLSAQLCLLLSRLKERIWWGGLGSSKASGSRRSTLPSTSWGPAELLCGSQRRKTRCTLWAKCTLRAVVHVTPWVGAIATENLTVKSGGGEMWCNYNFKNILINNTGPESVCENPQQATNGLTHPWSARCSNTLNLAKHTLGQTNLIISYMIRQNAVTVVGLMWSPLCPFYKCEWFVKVKPVSGKFIETFEGVLLQIKYFFHSSQCKLLPDHILYNMFNMNTISCVTGCWKCPHITLPSKTSAVQSWIVPFIFATLATQ